MRDAVDVLAGFLLTPNAFAAADVSAEARKLMVVMGAATTGITEKSSFMTRVSVSAFANPRLPVKPFSEEEQREIVFTDIDRGGQSHVTRMDTEFTPTHQNVIGYFARTIMRDLRLVGGQDMLFGKIKTFVEQRLFDQPVDLDDLNILRNLSEITATFLDPSVILTADEQAARVGSGSRLLGSDQVARFFSGRADAAHVAIINGDVGIIVAPRDRLLLVVVPRFENGRITHLVDGI